MTRQAQRGFTLIELAIVVAAICILSAIAIPNFLKYQGRAQQAEARSNLQAAFIAEKAYFHTYKTYTENMCAVGFHPLRGNRYSYRFSVLPNNYSYRTGGTDDLYTLCARGIDVTQVWTDAGMYPQGFGFDAFPAEVVPGQFGSFALTAAGNLDNDATMDQWSIASIPRTYAAASSPMTCAMDNNPAGEPCNDQNDI